MSAPGQVPIQGEDLCELVLNRGGVGEHAVGFGPAAVAGVEQDGLADAGELGEQGAHGQVQPGAAGLELPEGGWGHRIGDFEQHYADWRIESPDGSHLTAQRKVSGRPRGPKLKARTLDDPPELIDAAEGQGLPITQGSPPFGEPQ
jgi:hypothetical protein